MSVFRVRSLTPLAISTTQSRIEANITNDYDVDNSDESVAFSGASSQKRLARRGSLECTSESTVHSCLTVGACLRRTTTAQSRVL